jgi:hypothetical protein
VPADKTAITIHHLLTHTAGFKGDFGGRDDDAIARDDLVRTVLAAPLASSPGARFEYSNEGYSLLAAIVEIVSGKSYESSLHDALFTPAGMQKTGYLLPSWSSDELAHGYERTGDRDWGLIYKRGWRADGPGWYLRGNGGIHSTVGDLYRWHLALDGDTVLSGSARRKLFTPYVPTNGGDVYAYGWGVEQTRRKTTVVAHNGGNGIFAADFRRYVDEKTVIIAMTNAGVPATALAPRQLEALVFGDSPVPLPPAITDVPAAARTAIAGTYTLEAGGHLTVTASDAGLRIETDDGAAYAMFAGLVAPGGRFASIEARTRTIIDAGARGEFKPIFEAFDDERPFETIQGNQRAIWERWRSTHGDYVGADVLGTAVGEDPAVHVRLRFARGAAFVHCIWGPRRLVGFRVLPASPPATLLPESADTYVAFDYRSGAIVRATFTPTGVRVKGPATEIVGRR